MSKRAPALTLMIATVAIGTALALGGCANPLEGFVKGATKGQVDLSGRSVPADFPKTVPLFSGQVTSGVAMGQDGGHIWNVIMTVPGPQVMPTIAAQLKKAGFVSDVDTSATMDHGSLIFENKKYDVAVVLKHQGTTYTVDYAVSTIDN